MQKGDPSKYVRAAIGVAALALLTQVLPTPLTAQSSTPTTSANAQTSPGPQQSIVPPGTILPVVLRTNLSAETAKQNQTVRGQIAQDVPLPGDSRIRKGSRVEGQIVDVEPPKNGSAGRISIRFDTLYSHGQVIPIRTNLRAIAGFMTVQAASEPNAGAGESDVYNWLETTQIGGDAVSGVGGDVYSAQNDGRVVGKSLTSGGVLVQPSPNPSNRCRGSLYGNNAPQALWVFSSGACGTYGLSKVSVVHFGRTDPIGIIVFEVADRKVKLRSGDGLLLRVIG